MYYIETYLYFLFLAFSVISGIYYYHRNKDLPCLIFTLFLSYTLLNEAASFMLAIKQRNNMPLFHLYAVLQLAFITAYFLLLENKYETGKFLLFFTTIAILAYLNMYYLQSYKEINSNFLMFSSVIIVCLAVISLYRIIDNETIAIPYQNTHFWLWLLMLILWSATFFFWALYSIISTNRKIYIIANEIRVFLNIAIYAGIGITFLTTARTGKQPAKN